jgi:cytochrome P450
MMRITVNVIVRAVFGAEGAELDELRTLLPRMVETASRMVMVPPAAQRDFGRFSPWGRLMRLRKRYDEIIRSLIDRALADPDLSDRGDVLALLLQARYDDGSAISHQHVADELLTLLAAGHETTATTLAWAVERIRRHPRVLSRLVEEVDNGGGEFRQATILEVQRTRPVIDGTGRRVVGDGLELGEWVIPHGWHVFVSILGVHEDDDVFPHAAIFDPDRFVGSPPDSYSWIPFGGGTRRCVGSAFANMEMDVVLRTLLRHYELAPSYRRDERWHSRGIAFAPGKGGLAVVTPRRVAAEDGERKEAGGDDVRRTVQQVAG